jgi:hypothetical protein
MFFFPLKRLQCLLEGAMKGFRGVEATLSVDIEFRKCKIKYCRVTSSNASCLEPHPGFYRVLIKGIFDACVVTF